MPPNEFEFICRSGIINCNEDCCMTKIDRNIEGNAHNGMEIITKGQSVLTTALRWSKKHVKTLLHTDEIVKQERPIISLKEVADHDSYNDCWIVLYDRVYDVTEFLNEHPGGSDVILEYGGRDASVAFRGHSQFALKSLKQYEIGELPEKEQIYRRPGFLKCDDMPE